MPTITVYLTDKGPKTIQEEEWPLVCRSPQEILPEEIVVRRATTGRWVMVYGTRMGTTGFIHAGWISRVYEGHRDSEQDEAVDLLFRVGSKLGSDPAALWAMVKQMAPEPLVMQDEDEAMQEWAEPAPAVAPEPEPVEEVTVPEIPTTNRWDCLLKA
jgi:hypothetical protein